MHLTRLLILSIGVTTISVQAETQFGVGISQVDHKLPGLEKATGSEFYLGYRWHPNFAINASYTQFGDAELDDLVDEGDAVGANLSLILPLSNRFLCYGFAGIQRWNLRLSSAEYGLLDKDQSEDGYFGFGASVKISAQWRLGARYSVFLTDVDNTNNSDNDDNQGIRVATAYLELVLE